MEIQFSSLKNETVIFIIPHTINTITIHVFKILSSIIPDYFQYSFDRDGFSSVGSKQFILYLIFDYVIITQEFNPSPYFRKLSEDNKKLHNKIKELQNKGWGYTKIHTYLRKNGYKIGKSRTTVDSIIKKMEKRDEFYHQPIMDGYGNFRVEWREG